MIMKTIRLWTITALMSLAGVGMFFTSCATDDNPVTVNEQQETAGVEGAEEFVPTQLFKGDAYVSPAVSENIQQAINWSVAEVETVFPDFAYHHCMLYVVNKLTDIEEDKLEEIYDYGYTVLLIQPVESEIRAFQASHKWLDIDPTLPEKTWILGFSKNSKAIIDELDPIHDPLEESTPLDVKTYIALSGYMTALNTILDDFFHAAGAPQEEELKQMENAFASYHFVHTNSYKAHVHYDTTYGKEHYLDGTGAATTLLDVYPIHVYEGQAGTGDYFAVKMHTSVANANMWKGKGWVYRGGIWIRWCGLWCTNFDTKVEPMLDENTPMPVDQLQFLASCSPTPETTINKTEYEDSKSFSLNVTATGKLEGESSIAPNGDVTTKRGGGIQLQVSLGWQWNHKENYTLQNVEVEDRHTGNLLDWNVKFNDLPHFQWSEDYGFKITESLPYRNTQGLHASWMWYEPGVKDESATEPLLIKVTTNPRYEMQTFWTTKADLSTVNYNHSKTEFFKIPRPNNKCAGQLMLKNDLKDDMTIYDVEVLRKGTNQVLGTYPQTIPTGEECKLGWYLTNGYDYVVTFMAKQPGGSATKYVYTLNDGFKVPHMGKVTLYALSDFTPTNE